MCIVYHVGVEPQIHQFIFILQSVHTTIFVQWLHDFQQWLHELLTVVHDVIALRVQFLNDEKIEDE